MTFFFLLSNYIFCPTAKEKNLTQLNIENLSKKKWQKERFIRNEYHSMAAIIKIAAIEL
jgi:hypothetical protein